MDTNEIENVEVRTLDQRIDEVTDETLDSTRRILRTAEETNQIGVDTLITLNEQGQLAKLLYLFVVLTVCKQGQHFNVAH